MVIGILAIASCIVSVTVLAISLFMSAPSSPFIKGYEHELLMKAYGSMFLMIGYGVIPLSGGFLLAGILMFLKGSSQLRLIILTLVISVTISTISGYVSPESGGVVGNTLVGFMTEGLGLQRHTVLFILVISTTIISFGLMSPVIMSTAQRFLKSRSGAEAKSPEITEAKKGSENPKEPVDTNRTAITLRMEETSQVTDVINITQRTSSDAKHSSELSKSQDDPSVRVWSDPEGRSARAFELPSPDLLDEPPDSNYDPPDVLSKIGRELTQALESFGIKGRIVSATSGPVVNFFEFVPEVGIRASRIIILGDDIAIAMRMPGIRIVAPVPGSGSVGFEVPRKTRSIVRLKEVFSAPEAKKMKIPLTIGKDIYGKPFVIDLQKLPHLLIAGTTGSGKSVLLNTIIVSLLMRFTPEDMKFILVDPKMLEFSPYSGIPNLVSDVITSPKGAIDVLRWAVDEMIRRYQMMKSEAAKNIDDFVEKTQTRIPKIVVIIDEFSDLMVTSARKVEEYVMRLSQMARAAGIHLILTTQRPSADVVTGIIKSNLPARIALRVSDKINSRVILDVSGAETLLGYGDFLFSMPGMNPRRGHGCYISDGEIQRVVAHLKKQGEPQYIQIVSEGQDDELLSDDLPESQDPKFKEAVEIAKNFGQISISLLQRKLGVGFNRAARIVEEMEQKGIVKRQEKRLVYVGIPDITEKD